jgi:putative nucleotidyltransferase with HDIG domain
MRVLRTPPPWLPKAAIGFGTFLALTIILGLQQLPSGAELREGQVSPRDVEAPRTVDFVDILATERARRDAADAVRLVTRASSGDTEAAKTAVVRLFEVIARIRSGPQLEEDRAAELGRESPVPLSDPATMAALTLPRTELDAARRVAGQVVTQMMEEGIPLDGLPQAQETAKVLLRSQGLQGRTLTLASAAVAGALRPNQVADERATESARRRVRDDVKPVTERILRGEVIVRRGEVITAAQMQKLAAIGLTAPPFSWARLAGMGLISLLLLAVTAVYLRQYHADVWAQDKLLLAWCLGVVSTLVLARIMVTRFNPYLTPIAAGTTLIAVLLRPRIALYTAALLSLLFAVIAGGDVALGLVAFIGATVGAYAIKRINHRTDLIIAGLRVGGANALAITALGLADHVPIYPEVLGDAMMGVGNGVLVGIIAIGALPYLEHLFGLVTPIKLLELSNPGHPLLRRLQMEAPGTHHHSIMVANLAEAAAEAIGADAILARVGTYYHDIGKIRRPVFFIENQVGVDNPHDKMSPNLSALTVMAHVRDGLEYAREYRLPQAVADFIPQHHGTNLVTYFYHQAVERGDAPDEEAFRYEGPRPRTRETAIVMLADAAEGAARAMTRPAPDRLEQMVRRIIREKLEDGQLDECDLTFRDLSVITDTFTRLLASMFHPRVEYPDLERDLSGRRRTVSAPAR